jgi:hypothetical protein
MPFSRATWWLIFVSLTLVAIPSAAFSGRTGSAAEAAPLSSIRLPVDFESAETVGLSTSDGRFVIDGSLANVPAYAPFTRAGILTTAPVDVGGPIGAVRSSVSADVPDDAAIEVDVRGSVDGQAWTIWRPASDAIFASSVRFIQHRVTLLAGAEQSPSLAGLETEARPSAPTMFALQSSTSPTVRVFGSREGLIGGKTANGLTVTETDKFVALPSKKVLNPLGKSDYKVRISYEGRSVEVPVWDVGPWNQKDNYWDENREMFRDLPRFVPQAFAAWADNYNGGKDGTGRWVSFPASIDISDPVFLDDLKLKTSSWVDVTFLWIDGPSPPPGPTPPVLGLKPQVTKAGQPSAPEVNSVAAPAPKTSSASNTGGSPVSASAPTTTGSGVPSQPPPVVAAAPSLPAKSLFFPYVPVDLGVDSWIVLQNLDDQTGSVRVKFTRADGAVESREVSVPAGTRYSVSAGQLVSAGDYSVEVSSERKLAAERSIFLRSDAANVAGLAAPSNTWLFPEGSTEAPTETLLALANPSGRDAGASLTFLGERGKIGTADVRLAQGARTLVNLAEMVPGGGVSTIVEADQPLVAERLSYIGNRSAVDGTTGSTAASKTWSFADANTTDGSDAWLILMNPAKVDATIQARFFNQSGPIGERTYSVTGWSRSPIRLTDEFPGARFGIVLSSDQPIVAERSEYLNDGSNPIASLSVLGVAAPSPNWIFPEGASVTALSETIAVLNSGESVAAVQFELTGDKGRAATRSLQVPPQSTVVFDVPRDAAESTLSTRVTSDQPISVERQIRLGGGRGATGSSGIRL